MEAGRVVWREAEIKTAWSGLGGVNSQPLWSQENAIKTRFSVFGVNDFCNSPPVCASVLLCVCHTVEREGFQ